MRKNKIFRRNLFKKTTGRNEAEKRKRKRHLLTALKSIAAAILLAATLAVEYLPGTPEWPEIYAFFGLRNSVVEKADLLDLTVVFLDVGQGDCIFIYSEDTSILIDTGPYGNARKIKDTLVSFGVSELDYLIITHQHDDHNGSLPELRQLIGIRNEIIPDANAKMAGLTYTLPVIDGAAMQLQFLGPLYLNDSLNNMSLVMKLTYGDVSFFFTGDAEAEEEGTLLRSYDASVLKSDVLKVGHHGSDTSSIPAFIAAVSPSYAVISVGAGNDYGHPHAKTLATLSSVGAEVHRTDEEGDVVFTTDGRKIQPLSQLR